MPNRASSSFLALVPMSRRTEPPLPTTIGFWLARSFHPSLLVEVSDATLQAYGSSAEKLLSTLVGLGYTIHRLERHRISGSVTIEQALHWQESSGYIDLLFLHDRTVGSVCTPRAA